MRKTTGCSMHLPTTNDQRLQASRQGFLQEPPMRYCKAVASQCWPDDVPHDLVRNLVLGPSPNLLTSRWDEEGLNQKKLHVV